MTAAAYFAARPFTEGQAREAGWSAADLDALFADWPCLDTPWHAAQLAANAIDLSEMTPGWSRARLRAWLRVFCEPTRHGWVQVRPLGLLADDPRPGTVEAWTALVADYVGALAGDDADVLTVGDDTDALARLALAAGMTAAETSAAHEAGSLDQAAMHVLTALRG